MPNWKNTQKYHHAKGIGFKDEFFSFEGHLVFLKDKFGVLFLDGTSKETCMKGAKCVKYN